MLILFPSCQIVVEIDTSAVLAVHFQDSGHDNIRRGHNNYSIVNVKLTLLEKARVANVIINGNGRDILM